MNGIEKPCIFLTSSGRTGTQFFGEKMIDMIEDCSSFHEPDVLWLSRPGNWISKIRSFGSRRILFGRFSAQNSVRTMNVRRHMGVLSDETIISYLIRLRADFIKSTGTNIFMEANAAFNAFVDLLPKAFPNSRVIYIIRDPRDWVRSYLNLGFTSIYGPLDVRSWMPKCRLKAKYIANDSYKNRWNRLSQFERLCWMWNRENTYAIACAKRNANVRVYRFEDLFNPGDNYETFRSMLRFASDFPCGFQARYTFDPEVLKNKIHSLASGPFKKWHDWSEIYVNQLHCHCHNLMKQYRYGTESEWEKKLAKTTKHL